MTTTVTNNSGIIYVFNAEYSDSGKNITDDSIIRVTMTDENTKELLYSESASVPRAVMNRLIAIMSRIDEYSAKCRMYENRQKNSEAYPAKQYAQGELTALENSRKEYIRLGVFLVQFGNRMRELLDKTAVKDEISPFLMNDICGVMKIYAEVLGYAEVME